MLCPLSLELMHDPVTTLAGNTYEREEIARWFRTKQTDPLTGERLGSKRLVPNTLMRSQISTWSDKHLS
jgi:hypothetical protein